MARAKKTSPPINLDMAFFRELFRFYRNNKPQIRKHYKKLSISFLDYNDPDRHRPGQFLRRPQFEALEIYVFLKEYLDNQPIYEIFEEWYHREGPFSSRGEVAGMDGNLALSEQFLFNADSYEKTFKKMKASSQIYSNYIFALTMGVGKTLLMATCIFYEFLLANKFPDDKRFCHNALIFAPDKTVLQSLREIESFDFSKVMRPEYATWMQANLKLQYLDEAGTTLNVMDGSNYNLIVSNTQKIILKKRNVIATPADRLFQGELDLGEDAQKSVYDDIADLYDLDEPMDEMELTTNQRFLKLRRLPQLGVYVDEAHHAFGDKLKKDLEDVSKETSLRFTINALAQGLKSNNSQLVACYNFTGTPYIKNEILPEVVYAFGLGAAIAERYLKNPVIHTYTNTRDRDFVKMVIDDFLKTYGDRRYEGMLPKLAFFSPTIEDATKNLKPMLEAELARHGISANAILVNVGDEKATTNDDIKAFNELDTPKSEKQFIILVNKGKEGWNCRSLCGVSLFRKPKSKVFVLQATMRCLRSLGKTQIDGSIYLSEENYQILDDELQQNFRLNADEFQKQAKKSELFEVKVLRKDKKIRLNHVKRQYDLKEKQITDPLDFDIANWETDKYRAFHSQQKIRGSKLDKEIASEEVTDQKIKREWSQYALIAEIARYLCISPLKVERILRDSVDGIDIIVAKVNEFNELLYDRLIPFIFYQLYEIEEYEKKESKEVSLVNDPEGGSFLMHGKRELAEFWDEWRDKDPNRAQKSFHLDKYIFDSQPEKDFFERIIKQEDVQELYFTGMLTHGQSDFYINYIDPYTKNVRYYYPDFLILTKTGEWLVVEVKAANKIDDPTVQAKKSFAEQFLKESLFQYIIIKHDEINRKNILNY